MIDYSIRTIAIVIGLMLLAGVIFHVSRSMAAEAAKNGPPRETIVLAGGCFWGVQAVFQHTKGVIEAISGYAGGNQETAQYDVVSTGTTGHAESVKVTFDPNIISLDDILNVYFLVAHDPTQLNRQGPDNGTQYRSAVFVDGPAQNSAVINAIKTAQASYSKPIVTQVVPLKAFYAAEEYHQDYFKRHPTNPYICANDKPKVDALQKRFPLLYVP